MLLLLLRELHSHPSTRRHERLLAVLRLVPPAWLLLTVLLHTVLVVLHVVVLLAGPVYLLWLLMLCPVCG
jgi:hypothetical protein